MPVRGAAKLSDCLEALAGLHVIVVDDGSVDTGAVSAIARRHAATLQRHRANLGPAAARNTGARYARTELVAFVDADCRPQPGWLDELVAHFDDPGVGAVAPRIVPSPAGTSLLCRYESGRSALDMGRRPELVRPGSRLGFLPSATLVVRRHLVLRRGFDEALRFGEDVDLVWRLADEGWLVRYEPAATVIHDRKIAAGAWMGRRMAYGTSAGALARRHPGRLAPVRLSSSGLASILLAGSGHALSAAVVASLTAARLHRRLEPLGADPSLAVSIVASGTMAEAAAIGHALRREWWPLGAMALVASGRHRGRGVGAAELVSALMLVPIVLDWVRERPKVHPVAYVALRLLEDAAYGTGVVAGSIRQRTVEPFVPALRLSHAAASADGSNSTSASLAARRALAPRRPGTSSAVSTPTATTAAPT